MSILLGPDERPIVSERDDDDNVTVVDLKNKLSLEYATLVQNGTEYDPDAEFIEAAIPQANPFNLAADRDPNGNEFEVQATIFEVTPSGSGYRLHEYNDKASLLESLRNGANAWGNLRGVRVRSPEQLIESQRMTRDQAIDEAAGYVLAQRLREAGFDTPFSSSGGSGSTGFINSTYGDRRDGQNEFIPLMAGPYSKQLYQQQYLSMHAKSFEAFNHNPAIRRAVRILTDFTVGSGVDHIATNSEVGDVWREFVDRTHFYDDLSDMCNDLSWAGDLMFEFYDDQPFSGGTDFRMVDPSTIPEIVSDPEDLQKIYYYHQQYQTIMQQYSAPGMKIPPAQYIIRQIPASKVHHVKINASRYEKRGRSDIFTILGWGKRLKDLANAKVIKGQLEASFVFDVEVISGDADVTKTQLKLPDPYKAGSTFIHNSNVKLNAVTGKMPASGDNSPDIAMLLTLIALGIGHPKEFLGETSRGGRSGSLLSGEPGQKNYGGRQALVEARILHAVADRVIGNAVRGGILDLDKIMADARSVQRMGRQEQIADDKRAQAENTLNDRRDEQQQAQQDVADAQMQQAHVTAVAQAKEIAKGAARNGQQRNVKESLRGVQKADLREAASDGMTPQQKRRVETIKRNGQYSREFLEFMLPAITQEDRSAKLKDLALGEAMEWWSKRTAATLAAKEVNLTTYSFDESQAEIREEGDQGMSIAHVYGMDNKHVPDTVIAQDVQERDQAQQPAPETFQAVPVPPVGTGQKLVPSGGPGAPGGIGDKPNTGTAKTNKFGGPDPAHTDPTKKSGGYSAAANHPLTSEGRANIVSKTRTSERTRRQVNEQLLREALGPIVAMQTSLGKYILEHDKIKLKGIQEPETAVV